MFVVRTPTPLHALAVCRVLADLGAKLRAVGVRLEFDATFPAVYGLELTGLVPQRLVACLGASSAAELRHLVPTRLPGVFSRDRLAADFAGPLGLLRLCIAGHGAVHLLAALLHPPQRKGVLDFHLLATAYARYQQDQMRTAVARFERARFLAQPVRRALGELGYQLLGRGWPARQAQEFPISLGSFPLRLHSPMIFPAPTQIAALSSAGRPALSAPDQLARHS